MMNVYMHIYVYVYFVTEWLHIFRATIQVPEGVAGLFLK